MSSPAALDALGDPSRRAIVELLGAGPLAVGEIADATADQPARRLPPSAAARRGRPGRAPAEGTRHLYELRAEGIEAVQEYFRSVWGEAAARFTLLAENTTREQR